MTVTAVTTGCQLPTAVTVRGTYNVGCAGECLLLPFIYVASHKYRPCIPLPSILPLASLGKFYLDIPRLHPDFHLRYAETFPSTRTPFAFTPWCFTIFYMPSVTHLSSTLLRPWERQVKGWWNCLTHLSHLHLSLPAVLQAAWVDSVSAPRLSCPPQIWNLGAGNSTEQDPCAVGRGGASVDAAAAVDRALGACASVMMPAVSDMKASSVEVLGNFWEKGWVRVALPRVLMLQHLAGPKGRY